MDPRSLKKGKAFLKINLHPSRSGDAAEGMRDHLNRMLIRWDDDLEGVLMAYSNERITASQAMISPTFPYFHVTVTADVLLFCPKPGYVMRGIVNKISVDYVGILVLGAFNTSIGRDNIRDDLQFISSEGALVSMANRRNRIEEGCEVQFLVDRVISDGDYFSMTGSLLPQNTGNVTALARPTAMGASPQLSQLRPGKPPLHPTPLARSQLPHFGTRPISAGHVSATSTRHIAGLASPPKPANPARLAAFPQSVNPARLAASATLLGPGLRADNRVEAGGGAVPSGAPVNKTTRNAATPGAASTPGTAVNKTPGNAVSIAGKAPGGVPGGETHPTSRGGNGQGKAGQADVPNVGKSAKKRAREAETLSGASVGAEAPVVGGKSGKKRKRDAEMLSSTPAHASAAQQPGGLVPGSTQARAQAGGEAPVPVGKSAKKLARQAARAEAEARAPVGEEAAAPLRKSAKKLAREAAARADADRQRPTSPAGVAPTPPTVQTEDRDVVPGAKPKKKKLKNTVDGSEEGDDEPAAKPKKKKQKTTADGSEEGDVGPGAKPKKKKKQQQKETADGADAAKHGPEAGQGGRDAELPRLQTQESDVGPGAKPKKKKKQKETADGADAAEQGPGRGGGSKDDAMGGAVAASGAGTGVLSGTEMGGVGTANAGGPAQGKKRKKQREEAGEAPLAAVPASDPPGLGNGARKRKKTNDGKPALGARREEGSQSEGGGRSEERTPQMVPQTSGKVPENGGVGRKEKKRKNQQGGPDEVVGGRTADLLQEGLKPKTAQEPLKQARVTGVGPLANGEVNPGAKTKKGKKGKNKTAGVE